VALVRSQPSLIPALLPAWWEFLAGWGLAPGEATALLLKCPELYTRSDVHTAGEGRKEFVAVVCRGDVQGGGRGYVGDWPGGTASLQLGNSFFIYPTSWRAVACRGKGRGGGMLVTGQAELQAYSWGIPSLSTQPACLIGGVAHWYSCSSHGCLLSIVLPS
jgi:hypothetical protein